MTMKNTLIFLMKIVYSLAVGWDIKQTVLGDLQHLVHLLVPTYIYLYNFDNVLHLSYILLHNLYISVRAFFIYITQLAHTQAYSHKSKMNYQQCCRWVFLFHRFKCYQKPVWWWWWWQSGLVSRVVVKISLFLL